MGHSRKIGILFARKLLDHLAVNGKKTVLALALLVFMGFLWIRVLTGQKPGSAVAAQGRGPAAQAQRETGNNLQFVELPKLPGRNDSINRDFFTIQDRALFRQNGARNTGTETEVHATSSNRAQEVIQRVAQRLKLTAVSLSENPQAFINDRLLRVGDRLTIKEGANVIEFEVLRIYENSVLVGCEDTQLTLKLAQSLEVNN